jgi:hypothetical protein
VLSFSCQPRPRFFTKYYLIPVGVIFIAMVIFMPHAAGAPGIYAAMTEPVARAVRPRC